MFYWIKKYYLWSSQNLIFFWQELRSWWWGLLVWIGSPPCLQGCHTLITFDDNGNKWFITILVCVFDHEDKTRITYFLHRQTISPALDFKGRVDPPLACFLACVILRFTSGTCEVSMAAELFRSVCLQIMYPQALMEVWGSNPRPRMPQHNTVNHLATIEDSNIYKEHL